MNVFVLNTGRCGSTTFVKACAHITNYTSAHESRAHLLGSERVNYPDNHIESDNRLAWFLGRLDRRFGEKAVYVHLSRDKEKVTLSFAKRFNYGILKAYRNGILMGVSENALPRAVAADYCETIEENIALFLKDKPRKMEFRLENAKHDFTLFWKMIGAKGDFDAALREFDVSYNSSSPASAGIVRRVIHKAERIFRKLPSFLKEA
jgi:hypothetical protein